MEEERDERIETDESLGLRLSEVESLLRGLEDRIVYEEASREDAFTFFSEQFGTFVEHYGEMLTELAQEISAQGQQLQQGVVDAGSNHEYQEFTVEEGQVEFPLSKLPKSSKMMVFLNGILQPPDFSTVVDNNKVSIEGDSASAIVTGDAVGVFYFY